MNSFFALFFEFFGTAKCAAADKLYDLVYVSAGFALFLSVILWTFIYYQGFFLFRTKAKFDTPGSWIIWGVISSILTTMIIWIITMASFNNDDVVFGLGDYLEFLCISFMWAIILYFLFSLVMKNINHGRKKIPF